MATTKATELSQFSGTLTVDSSGNVTLTGSVTASNFLTGGTALLDSSRATALIDSAYIQARQVDLQRDSAFVTGIVDSAYIQARDRYRDSAFVTGIIDSSYIQARDRYRDSAFVTGIVDSAYVQNIQSTATLDLAGNTGTYTLDTTTETLTFLGTTGQINAGIATNIVTLELDQNINSITSIAFEGDSANNNETKLQAINPTKDNTINLPDSSGTIALTNDITTTVDSAYVRLRVKTNQDLQTSDNVTFADLTLTGNLQVNGTTTTINSTTLTINDKNIVLADSAANAAAADGAGITINGASATLTYASAGDNWVFNKAPYYSSARLITTDDKLIDSALTIQLVDSAYVQARQVDLQRDSAFITGLIDSAYILARAPEPDGDGLAFAIALG